MEQGWILSIALLNVTLQYATSNKGRTSGWGCGKKIFCHICLVTAFYDTKGNSELVSKAELNHYFCTETIIVAQALSVYRKTV